MPDINLKNILIRKKEALNILQSFVEKLHAEISIEDTVGNILYHSGENNDHFKHPVKYENEILGWVKGDENAPLIADMVSFMINEEAGRKNMGKEVLNLYKEINLVFNFSDKLANTIDVPTIAGVALEEASHAIEMDYGAVVLWNEIKKSLQVESSIGEGFFEQKTINKEFSLLRNIVLNGQSEITEDLTGLKKAGIIPSSVRSVMYSALRVRHRIMGAIILGADAEEKYNAASLKLLTSLALQSSSAIESSLLYEKNIREIKEREDALRKVYDATAKFVPMQFIRSLGHEVITDVKLGDQVEKMVTVLFTDIRNYTGLSEQMTPEETFGFISTFNERMGPVIRSHHGFINQYLGDSIMAIFPENAVDALLAAIDMQKEVQEINKEREGHIPIQIGIGMHSGPLIMGITGDEDRLDACTISDTVNTASRLESLTKHFKADILISESSLEQIENKEPFYLRSLGLVQLKGKQKTIVVFECFNSNSDTEIKNKLSTLSIFNEGVSHYSSRSFIVAYAAFRKVTQEDKDDLTAKFFVNHVTQIIHSEASENMTGIVEMAEK